jgi:hypothetical protein
MTLDDDQSTPDLDALGDEVGKAIAAYARAKAAHDGKDEPIIVAWAAGYEYTSVELEQNRRAGRGVVVDNGQMLSASWGLGAFISAAFQG